MSDFQSLDQELAQALMNGMAEESSDSSANSRSGSIQDLVNALVEAIPYYSDPAAVAAHKDALGRQLALNLPTAVVEAPPSHGSNSYMYRGSYSNYFQAYYRNVAQTASQQELAAQVTAAASQLNKSWWGNYSVAVLTDSCDSHYSVDIDDARLRDRLNSLHHEFLPGLRQLEWQFAETLQAKTAGISLTDLAIERQNLLKQWPEYFHREADRGQRLHQQY